MINELNTELYHPGEWRWQEGDRTVTRTSQWTAPGCHNGCGILVYTEDGKFVKAEGDPLSGWQGRLCARCLDMQEAVNHSDRLKYPLLRDGERGENKWKRISWDEAVQWLKDAHQDVCEEIRTYPGGIGPEGFVSLTGTGRNTMWQVGMLTRAVFGSCNAGSGFLSGDSCYQSRMFSCMLKAGDCWIQDTACQFPDRYDNPKYRIPEVVVLWGHEPLASNGDLFGHWYIDLIRRGTKFITIDPALTWLASKSELHLRPRVGTDSALAMTMLNVIMSEELYDKDFVEKWSYGFDELKEAVAEWTPEKGEEVTWVPADLITSAARMYADANPGQISWGVTVDMHVDGTELCFAINDLVAMCGNLDTPGGNVLLRYAYNTSKKYGAGLEFLSKEILDRRIGIDRNPILASGFSQAISTDMIVEQLESADPYPILMTFCHGTNPLSCTGCDTTRIYNAMMKARYNVVYDVFMTPTAVAVADLVLPAAMSVERKSFRSWWQPLRSITQCCDRYYESKGDDELIWYLGKEFNPDFFNKFERLEDFLTWLIQDEGNGVDYTYDELTEKVYDYWDWNMEYKKYEKGMLRTDGKPGFVTATGKYEFLCPVLDVIGTYTMPVFIEPYESPVRTPELLEDYPLLLTTGHRAPWFFHSEHRQLKYMRQFMEYPDCDISKDAAEKYGIAEGDLIWIESPRGKCKQIARIAPGIQPQTVRIRHGWWFPEQEGAAPNFYGTFEANCNNLTTIGVMGRIGFAAPVKGGLCKIYKVTPDNDCLVGKIYKEEGGFGGEHQLYWRS
ncbi:dehydrogenase [Gordonibacter sp. 28C]|uniref:molybdopterin-dependent oxidoreductase n=1 Tax=Gordonibacter sp. 28C TaxID=2078569 RepID=UPI000DF7AA17|nr:molybdopterin-dependent oxidoreductase [Gordonibacter sp. 28C]RDB63114.1 dehydrogenase [Gordonibacter sp. 28C]